LQAEVANDEPELKMLSVCRSSLSTIINTGQEHLRCRWISEKKGKRVFELESVEALKALD
jgi:hypothetical protein